jgi:uncharacterized protein with PhoU and TrkA domain
LSKNDDILDSLLTLAEIAKGKKDGVMVYAVLFEDAAEEIVSLRDKINELQRKILNLQGIEY